MELSEWCEQVPHGPYFQPIRLRLDCPPAINHTPTSPSITPTALPSTPPRPTAEATSNGHVASPGTTTPKRLKRRHKPAPTTPQIPKPLSDTDHDGFVLLPPFQSAHVGANRTVLNVGGPVWAMDWLPHDVYRAITTAATKQQKTTSRANKENVHRNVNGGVPTDAAMPIKDPLGEWRLLALSTHPPCTVVDGKLVKNTPPDHHYDAPQGGRNLVQIWAIPVPKKPFLLKSDKTAQQQESSPMSRMVPRLVYAIDHDSGVAWDVHWSPLTHKMPRYRQARDLLGVLAVAFGDGSFQIFEIPLISSDRLQPEPSEHVVERLQPIASGKMERIIQLSVRWSPHRPNLLLTGCSDGSVALWNLEELVSKQKTKDENEETYEMEPQRRFQDADTVGKQEPFDWGWGWVAVRSVCWSPFDENLFATTGNDSLFKIWDIREPRICFRSHRIRSTWGLAIQWMDDTSVQISGDQGSLYMYDVLSGSYQKLHFHPQIDSPVWDLQFARKGRFPILLSSCTSGSLRVAPAKKIFRAPQHSVEFCRLQGEKESNVELPHKQLTLNFEHRIVSGSAEAASPAAREFCERDASLHRVRLSTNEPGEFPCFLAAGGHAGLVILMEMQEDFDNLFENYFLQPSKKIGRPRKKGVSTSAWNGNLIGSDKPKKVVAPPKVKRVGSVKLSNFARMNGTTTKAKSKSMITEKIEYPEFNVESPSEAEYQDGESESESEEVSLGDDNSDDDRVIGSDEEDDSDCVVILESPESSNAARMRHEYQMDLSEEDAILLAIQMSELEQTTPQGPSTKSISQAKSSVEDTGIRKQDFETKAPVKESTIEHKEDASSTKTKKKSASVTKRSQSKNTALDTPSRPSPSGTSSVKSNNSRRAPSSSKKREPPTDVQDQSKKAPEVSKPTSVKRQTPTQPDIMYVDDMDQSTIQMHIYQQGMTEEDALREALRISVLGHMRRSNRKRKMPQPPSSSPFTDVHSPQRTTSLKRTKMTSSATASVTPSTSADEVTRRLEFATTSPPPATKEDFTPHATPQSQENIQTPPPKTRGKPSSGKKKAGAKKIDSSQEYSTPQQPTRKPTEKKSTPTKSTKKSPLTSTKKAKIKRTSSSNADHFLTDEELLALALQTSQIEY